MTKFTKLALGAVAAVCLSPSAFALSGAALDAVVGTDNEFFITGATASDNAIKTFVANDLCAGNYDTYYDLSGTTEGGNWFTMSCSLKAVAPVPAALQGLDVIIHKRAKIGSLYGIYPIALNSYVEFMNVKSDRGSGACVAAGVEGTSSAIPGKPKWDCTVGTVASGFRDTPRHGGNTDECDYQGVAPVNPVAPAAGRDTLCRRGTLGTSDVEAEMFSGVNLTNLAGDNFAKLTAAQIAKFNRTRTIGQLFGVAVSNSVWNALQAAQGLSGATPLADGSNWPSLTHDSIRQLLNGSVGLWSDVVHGAAPAGTINELTICRREQGSGTQASSNQFFFNYPCDLNNGSIAQDTGGVQTDPLANGTGKYFVKENTSSGKVKNCLNQSELAVGGADTFSGHATGAIGVLSYNGDPSSTANPVDTWKWIKIDGILPSFQNAMLGKYNFWYETQIGWNNTAGGLTAKETALNTALRTELAQPARITTSGAKGIGALTVTAGVLWDNGTNNTAFPNNYTATNPVFGAKHGAVNGFPAAGTSPISCRLIQNAPDAAATTPDRLN